MSITKFENVGSPQMVLRLLGGAHMLRKGDFVELDEVQVKHESVRSAIAAGDLVEATVTVETPVQMTVETPSETKPAPKAKATKVTEPVVEAAKAE